MKRILVTGASGYIGQHLVKALGETDWNVRGFGRSRRPKHLAEIEWAVGDIRDQASIRSAVQGCQAVVHLACLPLAESNQNPQKALQVNSEGTLNLLSAMQEAGVCRLVYASTAQVYAGMAPLPNSETNVPCPTTHYGASKLDGEAWCHSFATTGNMQVQILRLFNVYGAALDGTSRPTVETVFLQQLRQELRPKIQGHPKDGRDFVHIDDVIHAFLLAVEHEAMSLTVNVGTGITTTLYTLAELAADVLQKDIIPDIHYNQSHPTRHQACVAKADESLAFKTRIDLRTGLEGIIGSL